MIPRIFGEDAEYFNSMGVGVLLNTTSCIVTEELNGAYSLEATILATDSRINHVRVGCIITAKPNTTDTAQAFVIEDVKKKIDGTVDIYATHIAQYRTKLIPVSPFTSNTLAETLTAIKTNSLETNPFEFTTNKSVSTAYALEVPKSVRSIMGGEENSLLDIYRGEYHYDNFTIELLTRRGSDENVRVYYGKNMTEFESDEEFGWNESVTGCIPFWKSDEATVIGNVQYSSVADNFPYKKTVALDCSERYEEQPTVEQLNTYAQSWLTSKGNPVMKIKVGFNQYGLTDEQIKSLSLGDTIHVINNFYKVNYDTRIVSTSFDVLSEKYTELQIGALQATLNQAVSNVSESTINASGGGGGSDITVDDAMSNVSENPVENRVIKAYIDGLAGTKVDKVTGKGLSTNDFTNALLTKLNGIESGAEVNVQSNWAETDSTSDAYIQNKPAIPTVNNGTLTINVNGTGVGSFSANQSSDTTANITVPTKTSELTNDSGYVSGVDHASASNWGTVTFTSNEPGVGYATIGYSSNGSNTTSKLAKVDSSTNTISGDVLPSPTSTTKGGVTISDESDGSLAIGGYKVAPLVAPSNKISTSFLPDVDKWNGVALEKSATGAGGKYVPVLSSTSATTAGLSKVTTSPNDVGHIPVYDGDGWLYASTIDSSADGKAVANKTYVDTKVSSISVPTKTSDLTNDSGFITQVTSSDVTQALGYLPVKNVKDSEGNYFTKNPSAEVTLTGATTTKYGLVKVDDAMSDSSTNPVQNSVVKAYIDQVTPTGLITDVQVNGTSVVSNHVASITVPTKVSQLTNDSGYILSTQFITDAEIDAICV